MEVIACPRCQYTIQASPQLAGQQFACPQCQQPLVMPAEMPPIVDVRPRPRQLSYAPQRSPGVAAVLSFFWPGVGQIYNGEIAKGLAMFFVNLLLIPFAAIFVFGVGGGVAVANQDSPETGLAMMGLVAVFAVACVFGYWIFGIYDAYCRAQVLNYRGR